MDHGKMKQVRQLIEKHGSQLEGQALDNFLTKATAAFDEAAKAAAPVPKTEPVIVEAAPAAIISNQSVQPLLKHFYSRVLFYCGKPEAFTEEAQEELKRIIFLQNLAKQLIQQEVSAP